MDAKTAVLCIFVLTYILVLIRKFKPSLIAGTAVLLMFIFGLISPRTAFLDGVDWDVLGIYWGFMMVSYVFMDSRVPELWANRILHVFKVEVLAIVMLCAVTAFLSAFMQNVGVVLMMAPVAIATAKRLNSSLFPYIVAVAISSNVVTTVTMVADPPPIIVALRTGLTFFDFYWFLERPSIGTLSFFGVIAALGTLLFLFRKMDKRLEVAKERVDVNWWPAILFVIGVCALAAAPSLKVSTGMVGFSVGVIALWMGRTKLKGMLWEFDWDSFMFVVFVFVLVWSLTEYGILSDATQAIAASGIRDQGILLAFVIWISVLLSAFIDNVPFTILMIPVCQELAELTGMSAWPLLFGMLAGTGLGGNITPVGATANVFACGILEKHGYKVPFRDFAKISIPFTIAAVASVHILIHIFWLD